MSTVQKTPQEEFAEFIASHPTLEQIADYQLSDEAEIRIDYLLDGNKHGILTPQEREELDAYIALEHVIRLVKIEAYGKLEHI